MNHHAISELFESYGDDVYSFIAFLVGHRDVEDLVQETFLKAIRGVESYRGAASPKSWLFAIARNVVIDERRRQSRRPMRLVGEDEVLESAAHTNQAVHTGQGPSDARGPEAFAELNDLKRELLGALGAGESKYRDVVILRVFMDLPVAETAQILGWSESKVNVTLHRAIKSLRGKFTVEGGVLRESSSGR